MRLLLVCPATYDPEALQALCSRHECAVLRSEELDDTTDVTAYDAILLVGETKPTGTTDEVVVSTLKNLGFGVAAQSGTPARPLVGLGWGFLIICSLYGEDLEAVANLGEAAETLRPTDDGARLFQGTEPMKVHPTERWYIDQLAKQFLVLATSDSGIEAVKHKKQAVLALQLLPGDFVYPSDGKLVLENALSMVHKRSA